MKITELNMDLASYVTVDLPAEGEDFQTLVDELQEYVFDMGSHSDFAMDMAFSLNAEAHQRIMRGALVELQRAYVKATSGLAQVPNDLCSAIDAVLALSA